MALKQRYIGDDVRYEIDEWFIEKLRDFPFKVGIEIAHQLEDNYDELPEVMGWTQKIGGMCLKREPVYFELEFLNQPTETPVFLDINEIDVDEYLDYMIDKNTLKSNRNINVQKQSWE